MAFDFINAQSYIPSFINLYAKYSINRVLEFGEGDGTRFLLDNSDFVCSVEAIAYPYHKEWLYKCASMYKNEIVNKNWIQLPFMCSEELIKIDQMCQKGIQSEFSSYSGELQLILDKALSYGPFDLAFVDYGIHLRADMVNMLFNKINIIAAHDTNVSPDIYGGNRIVIPLNYTKIVFNEEYLGTTFWIKNDML
jgi:hypothetical protein